MLRTTLAAVLAVALTSLASPAAEPQAAGGPFAIAVHADTSAVRPGGAFRAALVLEIADHHKVYDETVSVKRPDGQSYELVGVKRPPVTVVFDELSGESRNVLAKRAVFELALRAPPAVPDGGVFDLAFDVRLQGCSATVCFLPEKRSATLRMALLGEGSDALPTNEYLFGEAAASGTRPRGDFTDRSPAVAILFALGFGLLLSFTPCVYPLIPITVAVIGARSASGGWRRGLLLSLVYVLGLSITYAALGVAAALGGSSVGAASQHWLVASLVAILFVALAFSMFGVYDLEVPAAWQKRFKMKRGGVFGVLFMGALSGLVATPCVAAPLASVLVFIATTGSIGLGAAMLFAMAWGMGVLLILAGTFSGLAGRLPKAGGWMVAVKMVMGVVLLVAALYFGRSFLPAGLFSVWIALPLVLVGIWRGIVARTPPPTARGRLLARAVGVTALTLGSYAALGAVARAGVNLPVVDGLLPDAVLVHHGKVAFREDYTAALAEARDAASPVMIDFVLPNCAGCRELERVVFSRDDVAEEARRFVTVRVDLAAPPRPVEEFVREYRIFGAPSVVWIDRDGTVRHELTVSDGATGAGEFLERMRAVR